MPRAASGGAEPDFLSALVEALPAGVFVIDRDGNVRFATKVAADLVHEDADAVVGRSVLEFVDEDTAWAYAAAVAMAADHPNVFMGPMRVTIVGSTGTRTNADLWATNQLDDPRIEGIVCLLTPETVAMGLAEAVGALSTEAPLTTVAARVVRAMRAHPTTSAAVLLARGPSGYRAVAAADVDVPAVVAGGPWDVAMDTGTRQLLASVDELPAALADDARARGFETVWIEPVRAPDALPRAVLVLWRDHAGLPTPNELNAMHQAAAILSLAWDRHEAVD